MTSNADSALATRAQNNQIERRPQKGLSVEVIVEMTGFDVAEIAMIRHQMAQSLNCKPDDVPLYDLALYCRSARALKLDPLLRQTHWISREGKGTLQTGIDGYRAIAERSGAYAGSEPPRFLGQLEVVWDGKKIVAPERAQVIVWKIVQGHKAAFTGEAHWEEFYPSGKQGFMWRKMPRHMLAKCAEGQALRKAFPAQLGSVDMSADFGEGVPAIEELPLVAAPPDMIERPRLERPKSSYDRAVPTEDDLQDPIGAAKARQQGTSKALPTDQSAEPMIESPTDDRYQAYMAAVERAQQRGDEVTALVPPVAVSALLTAYDDLLAREDAS